MASTISQTRLTFNLRRKIKLIGGALFLLILALGFNVLLSLNSLEKLYVESTVSQYSALGNDLQRNLENALRFGKAIEKFVGIEKLLEDTKQNLLTGSATGTLANTNLTPLSSTELSVSIAGQKGTLLYSTDPRLMTEGLPEPITRLVTIPETQQAGGQKNPSYLKQKHAYYVPLPVRDGKKTWVATALIAFDERQIAALLQIVRNDMVKIMAGILAGSAIILILLLNIVTSQEGITYKSLKRRIALVMLLVIGIAQILFSVKNTRTFGTYYLQINKQKAHTLTRLLQEDIEFLFNKGIRIDKLVKMEATMGNIMNASPELSMMRIINHEQMVLYVATKIGAINVPKAADDELKRIYREIPRQEPEYLLQFELQKDGMVEGYLTTLLSKDVIFARLIDITLDFANVLIISMLFFGEMLILSFIYLEQNVSAEQMQAGRYAAIRPVGFLLLFGVGIAVSFLPLYVGTLYKPLWGLSKDVIMGLPISVKMFFTGLGIVIAGIWNDRRGWHEPLVGGVMLAGLGLLYSWRAPDVLQFTLSEGLSGLGYGFALMAAQGFVITHTQQNNKAHGLSLFFAGVYAGSICGGSAGGMLAERIGYRPVFLIGAIVVFSVLVYVLLFLRRDFHRPEPHVAGQPVPSQTTPKGGLRRFLLNRNILGLILFSSFPTAIAIVGFLNYYTPIYLNRLGVSKSNIGRIFMLHWLCLVYIAPLLSKMIDASPHKKRYIIFGGILGGVALITFPYMGGITAAAVAVVILGLSSALVDSRNSYVLKFQVSQNLGAGKAMGIFSSVTRIGQVLGPIVFGTLLVMGTRAVFYAGLAYLVLTLFLMVVVSEEKQSVAVKQSSH